MKTSCTVLFLLLISFILNAQIKFRQEITPEKLDSVTKTGLIKADSCTAPYDLDTHIYPIGDDQYMLYFTWEMDKPETGWIGWDDGVHFSGIGSGSWTVAAKWDSTQLIAYQSYRLKKMRIILNDMSAHTIIFKVWNGLNNNYLIYQDTIFEYDDGVWVNHDFKTNLFIDSGKDLMIGYTGISVQGGNFPFGTDKGPAIKGYGDKISTDGYTWDNLSDFGLDYNWNIQVYVEDSMGKEVKVGHRAEDSFMQLSGYNLYQSIAGGEYEFVEFISYDPDTSFHGILLGASPDEKCFQLTAVWANPVDTNESAPAISKNNPEQDYVCVLRVGENERNANNRFHVKSFPNPFKTEAVINYALKETAMVTISVFNYTGELVYRVKEFRQKGNNHISWNAEGLPDGVYYFRLETENRNTSWKLIKLK